MDPQVFDPTVPLPPHLAVEGVDLQLHRIGLVPFSGECRHLRRSLIYCPIVFMSAISIYMTQKLISFTVKDHFTLIILADFGAPFGIKEHIALMVILLGTMVFLTMLVYRYNHFHRIEPTFLLVFEMLSGKISPIRLGLTAPSDIHTLLKLAKYVIYLHNNNKYILPAVFVSFFILVNLKNFDSITSSLIIVINGVIHSTYMFSSSSIIGFQVHNGLFKGP